MGSDRCIKHRKDFIGVCNWCGARMCDMCVSQRNGNKIYCDKCSGQLSTVQRAKIPAPQQSKQVVNEPHSSPKFEPYY